MKLGSPPPPPPDDEAADPLLAALRQRLGDYGQAPPPGAWAAIRQQLKPAALPRPWWRRPGRLLPALGLLLGWLLPSILGEPLHKNGLNGWLAGGQLTTQPLSGRPATATSGELGAPHAGHGLHDRARPARPSGELSAPPRRQLLATTVEQPLAPPHSLGSAGATRGTAAKEIYKPSHADNQALAAAATPAAAKRPGAHTTPGVAELSALAPAAALATGSTHARHRPLGLALANSNRRAAGKARITRSLSISSIDTATTEVQPPTAIRSSAAGVATTALPGRRRAKGKASASRVAASTAMAGYSENYHQPAVAGLGPKNRAASQGRLATRTQSRQSDSSLPVLAATQDTVTAPTRTAAATHPSAAARSLARHDYSALPLLEPADSLALKQTSLLLPASALPPVLVARPDSNTLTPHPVRRWSLLVVAGPTLSYRTLGPAPTLAARHPDFARLERPALGLGAQVQVRRVLSGRWALAVGVGYHEYATRLALSLKDSATSVHQRDTYRLLTVPVQFAYAWGAPKGRLTKALLLGAEPGWYMGGRSTEGADCGCHQQTYSATGSPYRTWSLAFSLGLDLRYRVGSADSRWQWLVQPTGRYVATPFVRSDAVGFTRRQPWSLGLMTGFSWDVR